jgi:hypothetical protein
MHLRRAAIGAVALSLAKMIDNYKWSYVVARNQEGKTGGLSYFPC